MTNQRFIRALMGSLLLALWIVGYPIIGVVHQMAKGVGEAGGFLAAGAGGGGANGSTGCRGRRYPTCR